MLKKIEITGAGIRPVSIDLTERNLIVGDHGVGKSTVLDAITILIEGKSPRGGDRLEDVVAMMPEQSSRMTITGVFDDGTEASRIIEKGEKNSQKLYIDGKKAKHQDMADLMKEQMGELSFRFNMGSLLNMSLPEQQRFIMSQFGNHLQELNVEKIKREAFTLLCMENEHFLGHMRFSLGKTNASQITEKDFLSLWDIMATKLTDEEKQRYVDLKKQIDKLQGSAESVAREIVEIVRKMKNDIDSEIKTLEKELRGYRKKIKLGGDVSTINEEIAKRRKELSKIEIDEERLQTYRNHQIKIEAIEGVLKSIKVEDDKPVRNKIDGLKKKLESKYSVQQKVKELKLYADGHKADMDNYNKCQNYAEMLKNLEDIRPIQEKIKNFQIIGQDELKDLKDRKNFLEGELDKNDKKMQEKLSTSRAIDSEIINIDDILEQLISGKCPLCHSDAESFKDYANELKDKKIKLSEKLSKVIKDAAKIDKENKKINKGIDEIKIKIKELNKKIVSRESALENLKQKERSVISQKENIETAIKNSPYAEIVINTIKSNEKKIEQLEKRLEDFAPIEEDLDKLQKILSDIENAASRAKEKEKLVEELKMLPTVNFTKDELNEKKFIIKDMIDGLEKLHEQAIENRTMVKTSNETEQKVLVYKGILETFKKMHVSIKEYHLGLFADALKGVTNMASNIYQKIVKTKDVVVITAGKIGVMRNGNYINMKYLGGAESCMFFLSIVGAIMNDINIPTKMVNFESGELMDSALMRLLGELKDSEYFDQINVVAYTRLSINATTKIDGWNVVGL